MIETKSRYYKVGIDLSTTNTGIVILNQDNEFVYYKDLMFRTFSENNLNYNALQINNAVEEIKKITNENIIFGIELSNFKDPRLTQRFSLYAGMFYAYIAQKFNCDYEFKTFNHGQWYKFVGKIGDVREITKKKSREFVKTNCLEYKETFSEDVCDAYCIAYFLEKVKTTEQVKIEIKKRKTKEHQEMIRQKRENKMIKSRLDKINKLDTAKNQKQIKKLIAEIEKIKRGEM